MASAEGQSSQYDWDVVGDAHCHTRLVGVSELPETATPKLRLNVKATVRVVPLPSHLEDEEDLEDHYKAMLLEDDVDENGVEILDFEAEKLEIDLHLDNKADSSSLARMLSDVINVPSGDLLSVARTILRDARAGARDTTFSSTANKVVRMEAFVDVDVVEEMSEVDGLGEPEFVPGSKLSIEKLERGRVEVLTGGVGVCCSICIGEIAVGSGAARMPCSHVYHDGCIAAWLAKSRFCPLCRFSMPAAESDDH